MTVHAFPTAEFRIAFSQIFLALDFVLPVGVGHVGAGPGLGVVLGR